MPTISDGKIGFLTHANQQYQSGDLAGIGADGKIRLATSQGTFGTNVGGEAPLNTQNISNFFADRVDNGSCILAINEYGNSDIVYVQSDVVSAITGGYELTELTWFGHYTPASYGTGWNIVAGISHGLFYQDIINLNEKLGLLCP